MIGPARGFGLQMAEVHGEVRPPINLMQQIDGLHVWQQRECLSLQRSGCLRDLVVRRRNLQTFLREGCIGEFPVRGQTLRELEFTA